MVAGNNLGKQQMVNVVQVGKPNQEGGEESSSKNQKVPEAKSPDFYGSKVK